MEYKNKEIGITAYLLLKYVNNKRLFLIEPLKSEHGNLKLLSNLFYFYLHKQIYRLSHSWWIIKN